MADVTVALCGADGTKIVLACGDSSSPFQLGVDPAIWGSPGVAVNSSLVAGVPGDRRESTRSVASLLPLPIRLVTQSTDELLTAIRQLHAILRPSQPMSLQVTRTDGSTRELVVHCWSGHETIEVRDHRATTTTVPLVVRADYPYWRDIRGTDEVVIESISNALAAGSNAIDFDNPSDVDEVWPELTLVGPMENILLTNLETGLMIRVVEELGASDEVVIRTDPRYRDVTLNGEKNWAVLDSESAFWPLLPGLNRLVFRGWDGTLAETATFGVRVSPRYLSC